MFIVRRRFLIVGPIASLLLAVLTTVNAEESEKDPGDLHEPVYRVTKQQSPLTKTAATALVTSAPLPARAEHPLDTALEMATRSIQKCREGIHDYTAILVKRERVSGRLNEQEYMFVKVRNQKLDAGGLVETPFSVYLKFLKPASRRGREVIFVNGHNDNKLIAHEGGFKGRFTPSLYLDPEGTLAMMGQRYPITDVGIEKLCDKLLERGSRDRETGHCVVNTQQSTINKRPATRIEVIHPDRKPHLDFHVARIFVDAEYDLPVRYEAYDWPRVGNEVTENDLIEEYTYVRLKFNVGLSDADFDPKNPSYNMK